MTPIFFTIATSRLQFTYQNHRGEIATRLAQPISMRYGSSEYYPEPQWLLKANDLEKNVDREFAMTKMVGVQEIV